MKHTNLLKILEPLLKNTTTITSLHNDSQIALRNGDIELAKQFERMIKLLHNSIVPSTVRIGLGTTFAYGGIATIIHADVVIGCNCSIGSNVTIGGGQTMNDKTGLTTPRIGDNVYVATGAKIFGGIEIGEFSIVAANAVVTSDVEPFTIVAGMPAKVVKKITATNYKKYKSFIGRNTDLNKIFNE